MTQKSFSSKDFTESIIMAGEYQAVNWEDDHPNVQESRQCNGVNHRLQKISTDRSRNI